MKKTLSRQVHVALAVALLTAACGRPQEEKKSATPPAQLRFYETSDDPLPDWTRMDLTKDGKTGIWIAPAPSLTQKDIETAKASKDTNGRDGLSLRFNAAGTQKAQSFSSSQQGKKIAIVLDGRLLMVLVVRDQFGPSAFLGPLDVEDMQRILASIPQN